MIRKLFKKIEYNYILSNIQSWFEGPKFGQRFINFLGDCV